MHVVKPLVGNRDKQVVVTAISVMMVEVGAEMGAAETGAAVTGFAGTTTTTVSFAGTTTTTVSFAGKLTGTAADFSKQR